MKKLNIKLAIVSVVLSCFLVACVDDKGQDVTPAKRLCDSPNAKYYYVNGTDTSVCFLPNAFTPNADGWNDRFVVYGRNIETIHVLITDNAGVNVVIDSIEGIWDGYINGNLAEEKSYTLTATGTDINDSSFTIQGTVSLIYFNDWNNTRAYSHPAKVNCDECTVASQWNGNDFYYYGLPDSFDQDTTGMICD